MRPVDFWSLHPTEFYWLLDAKRPRKTYAGGMSEAVVEELYEEAYGESAD